MTSVALLFIAASVSPQTPGTAVNLGRIYQKGEKLAYQVMAHITAESRAKGLQTWFPADLDINYNFTTSVTKLGPDGIAYMHYERPVMSEIEGETPESGPKETREKVNFDVSLTVSPINEILAETDLAKPGKGKKDEDGRWRSPEANPRAQAFFGAFIGDVHRLALFIGGIQDSLDFSPRLPLEAVKVGDTWKRTVGYQPQKLKGKDNKIAVQRLDYTYTYLGPMTVDGHPVLRVEAKLDFSTDLAEFLKQLLGDRASETNVTKAPLHFKSTIDFDLDPKTHDTLTGAATTEGGYQILLEETGSDAVQEERFKGRTTLTLVGRKVIH